MKHGVIKDTSKVKVGDFVWTDNGFKEVATIMVEAEEPFATVILFKDCTYVMLDDVKDLGVPLGPDEVDNPYAKRSRFTRALFATAVQLAKLEARGFCTGDANLRCTLPQDSPKYADVTVGQIMQATDKRADANWPRFVGDAREILSQKILEALGVPTA